MIGVLAVALLLVCFVAGLVLIPFGLPGLWVMLLGVLAYGWLMGFGTIGVWTIVIVVGLAFLGEIIEAWVGFKFAQRYGGSRSAGWGALVGGMAGAIVGVPIPIVGSIIGAFLGSFLGAAAFEYVRSRRTEMAVGAGWGALIGRAVGAAAKIALGIVIAVVVLFAAFTG